MLTLNETSYDLSATIYPALNLSTEEIEQLNDDCEQMIRSAFRENLDFQVTRTWPFDRFSMSRLGQEMHDTLVNLESVEFDRNDIESLMDLPVLDTLSVSIAESSEALANNHGARL